MGKNSKPQSGGGTPALQKLEVLGIDYKLHRYDQDTLDPDLSVGEAVAKSLGVDGERMFKTLIAVVDGSPVCAIVQVSRTLSMKALAKAAGGKRAEMAKPEDAERWTGYVTGGISPIGHSRELPCFLDAWAVAHSTVIVSAGKRGEQVELSGFDLAAASLADFVEDLGV